MIGANATTGDVSYAWEAVSTPPMRVYPAQSQGALTVSGRYPRGVSQKLRPKSFPSELHLLVQTEHE